MRSARIAIVGHVEHVILGRAEAFPSAGVIVHLRESRVLAAGGEAGRGRRLVLR